MGQITVPGKPGITVLPIDRETGPGAGAGNSGNDTIFLGAGAGKNNTEAQIIAIGNNAAGAGIAGANLAGSIFLGANVAPVLTTNNSPAQQPVILIGRNVFQSANSLGNNVAIGDHVAASVISPDFHSSYTYDNVLIGTNVANNIPAAIVECTVIGSNSLTLGAGGGNYSPNKVTLIGLGSMTNYDGYGAGDIIVIGSNSATNIGNSAQNTVIIGDSCVTALNRTTQDVYVGNAIADVAIDGINGNNVIVGYGSAVSGAQNTQIGSSTGVGIALGDRNIMLGFGAGRYMPVSQSDILDVSTFVNPTSRAIFWANLSNGNLLIGNSRANLDLDGIGCTNGVKIFNGSRGAGNPTGGGFFYVAAGALHWVGSAGTDTTIAPA